MKRFLLVVLIVMTLFVDYTALDDITTANQPDYYTEYVTLAVSVFVLVYSGYLIKKELRRKSKK